MDKYIRLYEEKKLEDNQSKEIEKNMKMFQRKRETAYVQKFKLRDPKIWYELWKQRFYKQKERKLSLDEELGTNLTLKLSLQEICGG